MLLENEKEPTNFDEANQATMDMFAGEEQENNQMPLDGHPDQVGEPGVLPGEIPPAPEQQPSDPPQIPTQPQSQPPPEMLLQRAFAEMQALKAENEQLKQVMSQQNDVQKQNVVDEALQMPTLDLNSMTFDDEETIKNKQGQYAQDMAKYIQSSIMKELSPFIEQARDGLAQKQKSEVVSALSAIPELQNISEMLPHLDNIINNNKALSAADVPLDEKYITAYLIASGLNGRNKKPDEMTPDKFMEYYNSNPDFKELIEKQRLAEIKGAQEVPVLSPSNGAVNAALSIPKTPTNFDEAYELSKNYFG